MIQVIIVVTKNKFPSNNTLASIQRKTASERTHVSTLSFNLFIYYSLMNS